MMGLAEITQEELAVAAGIHVSTINKWLKRKGELIPGRLSTLKSVMGALEKMGVRLTFTSDGRAIIEEFEPARRRRN